MPFADANGHRLYYEITGDTSKPKPPISRIGGSGSRGSGRKPRSHAGSRARANANSGVALGRGVLFLRREDAERFLAECLEDEPGWRGVLEVVETELALSPNSTGSSPRRGVAAALTCGDGIGGPIR